MQTSLTRDPSLQSLHPHNPQTSPHHHYPVRLPLQAQAQEEAPILHSLENLTLNPRQQCLPMLPLKVLDICELSW